MNTLLLIGIIILVLWLLGFVFFRSLGFLIHIALIIAVILLIIWLLRTVLGLFQTVSTCIKLHFTINNGYPINPVIRSGNTTAENLEFNRGVGRKLYLYSADPLCKNIVKGSTVAATSCVFPLLWSTSSWPRQHVQYWHIAITGFRASRDEILKGLDVSEHGIEIYPKEEPIRA